MQTTLRLDDKIYREAKAEAARQGRTITQFIEDALRYQCQKSNAASTSSTSLEAEIQERNDLMEALLQRTAHFRIGSKPTRGEMNER
jgi:hypothetical protein